MKLDHSASSTKTVQDGGKSTTLEASTSRENANEACASPSCPCMMWRAHWGAGVLLFVSSYFDFVRVRGHLSRAGADFLPVSEYATHPEAARARSLFARGKVPLLLYTERAHFYHRPSFRNVQVGGDEPAQASETAKHESSAMRGASSLYLHRQSCDVSRARHYVLVTSVTPCSCSVIVSHDSDPRNSPLRLRSQHLP